MIAVLSLLGAIAVSMREVSAMSQDPQLNICAHKSDISMEHT